MAELAEAQDPRIQLSLRLGVNRALSRMTDGRGPRIT